MLNKKKLDKIKHYLVKQKDILVAYLYGSQTTGEANKNSDIDLAVLFDENKRLPSSWGGRHISIATELSGILQKEVEVQDLSLVDISFCHRVLSEGKLIYSKKEKARTDFEVNCLNKYFDLKPLYQEYSQTLQNQARKGAI